jgi:pimeloyl-ACP methyl ester carboxylesterase
LKLARDLLNLTGRAPYLLRHNLFFAHTAYFNTEILPRLECGWPDAYGEIIAQHSEWKPYWYDAPDGQYGRPAAFYQQLQGLNLGEVWQNVTVPVLVLRGTADNIMSDADARALAEHVNRVHAGFARYEEIKDADHLLTVNGRFADEVVPTMLNWMREQLAK